MKRKLSIQLKAAFLLLVFAFNTLIGFACAIGIDMGFNSSNHHDEEATEVHVHADGKRHDHLNQSEKHKHKENKTEKKRTRNKNLSLWALTSIRCKKRLNNRVFTLGEEFIK